MMRWAFYHWVAAADKKNPILSCIVRALFYIENGAEMFRAHYAWKVAEKGLKMAFIMNKIEK